MSFSPADVWRMSNQPREVVKPLIRVVCAILLVGYIAVMAALRATGGPVSLGVSGVVMVYITMGVVGARWLAWRSTRIYVVGLELLLSLTAGYIQGSRGYHFQELALTALATFVPLCFLLTGWDVVITCTGLAVGHAVLLMWLPTPAVPIWTIVSVLAGTVATGASVGIMTLFYRAGVHQSMLWWRQACTRERLLREFAEIGVAQLGSDRLLDSVAMRFLTAFGPGRCTIILKDADGPVFRTVASAGLSLEDAHKLRGFPMPTQLAGMMALLLENRQPLVCEYMDDGEKSILTEGLPVAVTARSFVALPVVIGDLVGGLVLLTCHEPQQFPPERLQVWQAMAYQVGMVIANLRLVEGLRKALGAKTEFLNTMSHELRSPLHVIVGYAEMLAERDKMTAREIADRIRSSALELLQLVENTMDVSRLDAGHVTLRVDEFAPQEVVRELAETVRALPEGRSGVPVYWEVAPDVPQVRLDRLKLKEILQNLVSNALKYTRRGEVRVSLARENEQLRVTVRDTGVGIPLESQDRIFDVFERLERDVEGRRPAGVGLGLYIVKKLVQLMGGTIQLESRPGEGSTMTVRLPLALKEAQAA